MTEIHPRLAEALDLVVSRTGVERYRQLCDPAHPRFNPEYIPWVLRAAGFLPPEPDPPPPPIAAEIPATPPTRSLPLAFPDCSHRGDQMESGGGCGCGPKHLCRRDVRIVSALDCTHCLAASAPTS